MKVLLINGSPRAKGCTYTALMAVAAQLEREGLEWELVQLGNGPVRDCIACGNCEKRCPFGVPVTERMEKVRQLHLA